MERLQVVLFLAAIVLVKTKLDPEGDPLSRKFNIGGVVNDNSTQEHFTKSLRELNFDGVSVAEQTTLYDVIVQQRGGPITTALLVCDHLIPQAVYSVVVASPSGGSVTTAAVSYTSGFYHIPVICTHSRDSAFSDKNIHLSFLRTVPPYSHQADVWVALLKHLQYRQVILIHSSDADGRALHSRFQNLAQQWEDDKGIKMTAVIEFSPGEESFVEELNSIKHDLVKVILLYASENDAARIFHDASYLNMTEKGYVWLVTEQALTARYAPVGILGFRLKYAFDHNAHISDALRVVALALRNLHEQESTIVEPPNSCDDAEEDWNDTGKILFKLIKEQVLPDGKTGKVTFDDHGDRTHADYSLVNIQHYSGVHVFTQEHTVGEFFYDKIEDKMKLLVNLTSVVWPGNTTFKPAGYSLPRHLKVMTIREKPFVYAEYVDTLEECNSEGETICPVMNPTTGEEELMCCWGLCMDLLENLAGANGFTYDLHLAPDGHYGEYMENATGKKEWTGLIGQLVQPGKGVDLVIAPLTINPERSQAIDFTKPFKYHGITILIKRVPHVAALVSILQPFQNTLWLLLLATVHVIALVVWLLDRLSPVYKLDGGDADSLVLSESFWFSWAVILNSGLSEGTPRCFSGRVLGIVWGGFAMIMVASYTANLAAFLVLESPITSISGISDPRLRNPVDNFIFATVRESSVDMFFRRKTEWSNMYRVMEAHNYDTADEAIQAVRNGTLQAFIWESSRLEYEASQDCDLVTVGEIFGRSGYGIGLKKGSPWTDKITLDILDLHERGYMETLDRTWIWNRDVSCREDLLDEDFSKRLGLRNLEGIFIMIACGVFSGIFLVLAEILYDRCKKREKSLTQEINDEVIDISDGDLQSQEEAKAHSRSEVGASVYDSESHTENSPKSPYKSSTQDDRWILPGQEQSGEMKSSRDQESKLRFLDPHAPESQALLQDIEERLRKSQNIPEPWKSRPPIQWFYYYLDIINRDISEGRQRKSTDVLIEDLIEFLKEINSDGFDDHVKNKIHIDANISAQDNITIGSCDQEAIDSKSPNYMNKFASAPDQMNADVLTSCIQSEEKTEYGPSNAPCVHNAGKSLNSCMKHPNEKLPDVVDNCSDVELQLLGSSIDFETGTGDSAGEGLAFKHGDKQSCEEESKEHKRSTIYV